MRSDEWARYHEVQAIKGQSGKFGQRARKVIALIWGDLITGRESGNTHCEESLSEQESAEAIVPLPSNGKGRTSSGWEGSHGTV